MAEEFQKHEGDIYLLPFFGQGHLFPFIELAKHLSTLNFTTTLLLPSSLSTTIPTTLGHHIRVAQIPSSPSPLDPPPGPGPPSGPHEHLCQGIESLLSGPARPICAIIDVMMGWARPIFEKFSVPVAILFTSGACSAALEYATWKDGVVGLGPGHTRVIDGLPKEMAVSYSDLARQARHPGPPPPHDPPNHPMPKPIGPPGPSFDGPPGPGFSGPLVGPPVLVQRPMWAAEVEGVVAVLINTCQELEGPFLDYLAKQLGNQVLGVGPLLPHEYWKSTGPPVHDHDIRSNKPSNYTEEEVKQWLDSKPCESVLYISFGSEVGPTDDEFAKLAAALEELDRPFIWVIVAGSQRPGPSLYWLGLESKVGERGLIIHGWAPQLLILSHPSTGGFLSHCGWNSTLEAIGRAVPILAWPIRGDQHHNAKLVVCRLKVGYMVQEELSSTLLVPEIVKKDDIVRGIEKLMTEEGVRRHAKEVQATFQGGFPASSRAALEAFRNLVQVGERVAFCISPVITTTSLF